MKNEMQIYVQIQSIEILVLNTHLSYYVMYFLRKHIYLVKSKYKLCKDLFLRESRDMKLSVG